MVDNRKPFLSDFQNLRENRDYYSGNTWQFWIGARVAHGSPQYLEIMNEVFRVFQSANKIQECIDRHRRALISKPPIWYFTNPEGDRTPASTADLKLQRLIDRWSRRKNPLVEALTATLLEGKGYLRLWSPVQSANSPNPYDRISIHSPAPGSVEIKRDGDDFIQEIKYRYSDSQNQPLIERQYLNPQGLTVFETIRGKETIEQIVLNLGGGFSIVEMQREPLITDTIKRAQNGINYALTMLIRNIGYSGFLRELILNGQPPGEWVEDRSQPNGQKFVPNAEGFETSPGITNFVMGAPTYDAGGNITGYTSPNVNVRQPIDPSMFLETVQAEIKIIYESMGQGHILATDSQLSGVSRVQLRQDFVTAIGEDALAISGALAEIYKSALLMLDPESANLDLVVKCQLSVSQPTPEEMREIRANYQAGLLSRSTAMSLMGIDNPDAEAELISEENESKNTDQNNDVATADRNPIDSIPIDSSGSDSDTPDRTPADR